MCSVEFLFTPDASRGGCWNFPWPVPAASQTTSHPAFGLRNIAIFALISSRRKSLNNSDPVPHFSPIMTSKIRGVGEMRYNQARSRPRCTRIFTGVFCR